MAKDKYGHGSNGRGVSAVQARNDRMHAMFDRARAQGHTTFNAEHDAAAATELARGNPKSDAAPVHAGAAGRSDFGPGHTVSQITLGGKVKQSMSGADYATSGGKFPGDANKRLGDKLTKMGFFGKA